MDEFDLAEEQQGASAGITAELPMIVWLRGDEDVCADFVLDADQVMQQLGIRRSRLTQISGRELRVGRIRRGRYISPVFRQEDVSAYLAWTRATASQLKSSNLVHEATAGLMQESERLAASLKDVPQQLAERIERDLAEASSGILAALHEQTAKMHEEFAAKEALVLSVEQRLRAVVVEQGEWLRDLTALSQAQALQVQALTQSVAELTALAHGQQQERRAEVDRLQASEAAVLGQLQDLQDALIPKDLVSAELKQLHDEIGHLKAGKTSFVKPAARADARRLAKQAAAQTPAAHGANASSHTAYKSKLRSRKRRIKVLIVSSIESELVSNTTASEACLSGAVSRP